MLSIIRRFDEKRVLVIGDLILDRYINGEATRLSTESPIPIINITDKEERLGGASNTANNIISLGGKPEIIGVIGNDFRGKNIIRILRERGIRTNNIIIDNRITTTKTRIIARLKNHTPQQVIRYDEERTQPISGRTEKAIINNIRDCMKRHKTIIISDYNKGLLTEKVIDAIKKNSKNKTIIVDTKPSRFELYKGLNWFTPNNGEIETYTGIKDNLSLAANNFYKRINPENLLITAGDKGMYLYFKNNTYIHIPAIVSNAVDVSGAGDTVVASLALSLETGAGPIIASQISSIAASVVVQKNGTSTANKQEIIKTLNEEIEKIEGE